MIPVIDWSHWQDDKTGEPPDLSVAEDKGVQGHIFRAGRGKGQTSPLDIDPSFDQFVSQAQRPWSPYWYHEPYESTAKEQMALYAWTVYAAGNPTLPWHLNVENIRNRPAGITRGDEHEARWLREAVDEIKTHSKQDLVIVYTYPWYWSNWIAPVGIDFRDCDLRIASYITDVRPPADPAQWQTFALNHKPNGPTVPDGWDTWDAWQFSSTGYGEQLGAESENLDHNLVKPEAWARWTNDIPFDEDIETMIRRVVQQELAGVHARLDEVISKHDLVLLEVDGQGVAIDRLDEIVGRWDAGLAEIGGGEQ